MKLKKWYLLIPPWITKQLKTMLNRKNSLFENYKKHGYKRRGLTLFATNVNSLLKLPNTLN